MKTALKNIFLIVLVLCFTNARAQDAPAFYSSNLPIVVINTGGVPIPDEPKIAGTMKIIDNGPGQRNYLTDQGNIYSGNIGIEIRGSYSASLPQKPYGLETRDVLGNDSVVSLFGWPAESDWVMLANYNDKVFMRNSLAFKLFNETNNYASRTKYVEAVVNGAYMGIYVFGEKIKRDNGRVDIAKLNPDENSGNDITGGYIFKVDYWNGSNSWLSGFHPLDHPNFNIHYVYYYPDLDSISWQQKNYIKAYVSAFESRLYDPVIHDSTAGYYDYMDIGSFIDYFIVNEVARNNDGFKKSFYFNKDRNDRDRRIHCGPVWDFDWAWKNINECYIFAHTDGSGWAYKVNDCWPDNPSPYWHGRLLQDTIFTNALKCRWLGLRQNILNIDTLNHWIDDQVAMLDEAQERHYVKWPILGINVGTPEIGPIPQTWDEEIAAFRFWIWQRINWLDDNMPGTCNTTANQFIARVAKPAVFPVPASTEVFIEINDGNNNRLLDLYTLEGKNLISGMRADNGLYNIDVSSLQSGIYLAALQSGNSKPEFLKIIVQH